MADKLRTRQPKDTSVERQILIGMITSTPYLKNLTSLYTPNSLSVTYMKVVADWCIEYFQKFSEAPFQQIQDIFRQKKDSLEEDQVDQIERFLVDISEEFEENPKFNVDFYLEEAEKYFDLRSIETLDKDLRLCLQGGRIEDAHSVISKYKKPTRIVTDAVDLFRDHDLINDSLGPEAERDRLIKFPGDLGEMLDWFGRSQFGLVVGSTGRGKSWWLMYLALMAVLTGFNVLFVSLEMSRKQMMRRVQSFLSGRPTVEKYSGLNYIPVFDCLKNQTGECRERTKLRLISSKEEELPAFDKAPEGYLNCHKCKGKNTDYEFSSWYRPVDRYILTPEDAIRKSNIIVRSRLRGRAFRLIDPPPLSMKASELRTYIDNLEFFDGWVPDVVVTDYIDKFAPEDKRVDYRHRIYETTLQHKTLSAERKILVFSGSQSNTSRDEEKDVPSGGLSEDIRKKYEIDFGFSLNQTEEEKMRGIMRIGVMKQRDYQFNTVSKCIVLQNLKLGRVYMGSYYPLIYM